MQPSRDLGRFPLKTAMPSAVWLAACVAWLQTGAMLEAHTLPISSLLLVAGDNQLHLELTLNPFELGFYSAWDANRNGRLDAAEWESKHQEAAWQIVRALKVTVDGRAIQAEVAGLSPSYDSHHITVRAHYPAHVRDATVVLESDLPALTSGSHFTQVTFREGNRTRAARLDVQSKRATFEPSRTPVVDATNGPVTPRLAAPASPVPVPETSPRRTGKHYLWWLGAAGFPLAFAGLRWTRRCAAAKPADARPPTLSK